MVMPTLLAELDDTVLVEFSQFVLQEIPMLRIAQELAVPPEGTLAVGGPGGIVFLSQASDHYPQVRIELWSGRPEPIIEDWDASGELTTNLASAVKLKSLTMEMSDQALQLPQAGDYGTVVHVRRDPRVAELEEGSFARTAERWLVQLWHLDEEFTQDR
jgi:hypothetical protein